MLERRIELVDDGYVVYTEDGRRLDAYLTAASAERAATRSLRANGGGRIVRLDGTTIDVQPEQRIVPV